jgi:hypothetical protein
LTYERAHERLKYCRESGHLTWRQHKRSTIIGKRAGAVCGRYMQICVDNYHYRVHRVIWLMETGKWPQCLIDHMDGDGLNNRWHNLRAATYQQNAFNKRACKNSKSGLIGVSPTRCGRWQADIGHNGKVIHLGKFECVAEAVAVRCEAERHYFGDFARMASRYGGAT